MEYLLLWVYWLLVWDYHLSSGFEEFVRDSGDCEIFQTDDVLLIGFQPVIKFSAIASIGNVNAAHIANDHVEKFAISMSLKFVDLSLQPVIIEFQVFIVKFV